jgi:protein phosphatase
MINNISFAAQSDMGKVRANNEDNLYCDGVTLTPETRDLHFALSGNTAVPCMLAVCDGMGGQEDGEFASLAAVTALGECAETVKAAASASLDAIVQEFVTKTNGLLCDKMREKSVRIGTTFALVIIAEQVIKLYNLGDSRIYALYGDRFSRVSEEHTLTEQKVKMGLLTEEQAEKDRDRHKLTQYLGIFEDELSVTAEVLEALPRDRNCRLLLCSDGLTDMVKNARIEEVMRTARSAEDAVRLLVAEALENGGRDNVTCIVADAAPTRPRFRFRDFVQSALTGRRKYDRLTVSQTPNLMRMYIPHSPCVGIKWEDFVL